VNALSLLGIK